MASNTPAYYWDAGRQRLFQIRPHTDGFYWMVFADIPDIYREIPRLFRQVPVPTNNTGESANRPQPVNPLQPVNALQYAQLQQYTNSQQYGDPQQYQNYLLGHQNYRPNAALTPTTAVARAAPASHAQDQIVIDQHATIISGEIDSRRSERLDPSYELRDDPRGFFRLGKVFQVLWHEPAGYSGRTNVTEFTITRFEGERVHSKIRRFVVVREGDESCSDIPINTYNGRGLSRTGVKKSEHGIIHTGRAVPELRDNERPGRREGTIRPRPIRVIPTNPSDVLDPLSRINFGKVYTVEFNIKAKDFGQVQPSDLEEALMGQFADVFFKRTS